MKRKIYSVSMAVLGCFIWSCLYGAAISEEDVTRAYQILHSQSAQKVWALGAGASALIGSEEAFLPNMIKKVNALKTPNMAQPGAEIFAHQHSLLQREAEEIEKLRLKSDRILASWRNVRRRSLRASNGWGDSLLDRLAQEYDEVYGEFLERYQALSARVVQYKRNYTVFVRTGHLAPQAYISTAVVKNCPGFIKKIPFVLLFIWAASSADSQEAVMAQRLEEDPALAFHLSAKDMAQVKRSAVLSAIYTQIAKRVQILSSWPKEELQEAASRAANKERAVLTGRLLARRLSKQMAR